MTGHELKHARRRLGLSQQTLAAELGLTQTFIGLMERGEKPIERRTELAVRCLLLDARLATPTAPES